MKKLSASKVVLAAILLICLEIIIYAEVAMYMLGDLSALYVLIGVPASMAGVAWAYFSKTKVENSEGGLIYEAAMLEKRAELGIGFLDNNEDDSVG